MTRNTFFRKVLEHLGVVAADDPADASDIKLVSDRYASLYDMLLTEKLISWPLAGDIPDYTEIPLVQLMGWACAKPFGMVPDPQDFTLGIRLLRRQLAKPYIPYRHRAEYF